MSSPYPVLDNKPIDQWKVTELKEELKRRKLATKGLKDDLIRRLDEALRAEEATEEEEAGNDEEIGREEFATPNERDTKNEEAAQNEKSEEKAEQVICNEVDPEKKEESVLNEGKFKEEAVFNGEDPAKEEFDNGLVSEIKPQAKSENAEGNADGSPVLLDTKVHDDSETAMLDNNVSVVDTDGSPAKLDQGSIQEEESVITIDTVEVVTHTTIVSGSVENNIKESRGEVTVAGLQSQKTDTIDVMEEDSMPSHEDAVLNDSNADNQVSEVSPSLGFQVKSDSISTDSVSIKKNELKDNLNADNFHIELDNVKSEMVQPSSSAVPHNGGDINPPGDQEPCENKVSVEEMDDINATNVDLSKKIDNADGGSSEKLNLDRSSGDDSMEEDVLESKQVESNHISEEVEDRSELIKDHVMKEGSPVNATGIGFSRGMKDVPAENNSISVPAEKRKHEDHEVRSNEPPKRRRWNTETIKIPEPQSSNLTPSTTPKDAFQPKFPKRNFNRSDSTLGGGDTPKERVVPPSPKSPTTSLKIDRFLRPFTLKAVHELLAKTGIVSSFWMDHIKTHCFVTFSSVEEAIETRNALYNLQWPPNGGRLLVADFVEPQEVKIRAEAPPQPTAAPVVSKPVPPPPASSLPQPSPRQSISKQQLPPPPIVLPPPPPPPSDPRVVRERLPLPPPPPLIKKPDPPIVTLDDLFRKTRATPRIYYLPLSEEQVAAKVAEAENAGRGKDKVVLNKGPKEVSV